MTITGIPLVVGAIPNLYNSNTDSANYRLDITGTMVKGSENESPRKRQTGFSPLESTHYI